MKMRFTLFLLLILLHNIYSQQLPLIDNFNNDLSAWTIVDDAPTYSGPSNWYIDNGVLRQTSNIWAYAAPDEFKYHLGTHIVQGNDKWSNYTFNVNCRATDNDGIGILFRYIDKNNYYRFIMVEDNGNGGPVRKLQKFISGEPVTIYEEFGSPAIPDKWFSLTATLVEDSIYIYINGELFTKQRDTKFSEGKVGLTCYAMSGAYFDSVSVTTEKIIYQKPEVEDFIMDRLPYIQLPTTNSVAIAWNTKENSIGKVKYGLTENTDMEVQEDSSRKKHFVNIKNLTPNTKYFYQVYKNDSEFSEMSSFYTVKPDSIKQTSFLIFGDSGTGNDAQKRIADLLNRETSDFIIHVGDVSQFTGEEYDEIFFKPYQDIVKRKCIYTSLGNHDVAYDGGNTYLDNFYLPGNNPENSERYYSFSWANTFFINIDSNIDYLPGSPQYNFIVNQLESDKRNLADWTFVYFHHPAYCELWDTWAGEQAVRDYLLPLFEKYNVDMVFNGHTHGYERGILNGIYYIISGGGGGGLDSYGRDWPHIQKSIAVHHYTKVVIDNGKLELKAIDIDGNIIDQVSVLKNITDVKDASDKMVPQECLLYQNYPNPFNPTTVISYQLAVSGMVELKVYDLLGKEVIVLVNENQNPGNYSVSFDGENLASGTYIFTLKADNYIETKKMLLLK